ncbi:hypothetical protein CC1G_09658 [Coprinopsis cinerea okayama7|uniref:Uncharacterized protein n=1 Tax=Coprinopsis cinerea (strain Okayama-7 / 130 / ATCC MYA-4618 / FGSC 9003) TaxID=240176 RepID=A8P9E5_COPC7|nr:hypothetical protein CC1G_09658 [Coprinopsis cinerea okayama7\|eukprot:XP_001839755.1 hypothetical protein CC1G_09658 [Coprinopsis cinerea okayama7\
MAFNGSNPRAKRQRTTGQSSTSSNDIRVDLESAFVKDTLKTKKSKATLEAILRDWSEGKYPKESFSSPPLVAHILDCSWLHLELFDPTNPTALLAKKDADKLKALIPIAAKLGFTIAFAGLKYTVSGESYGCMHPRCGSGGGGWMCAFDRNSFDEDHEPVLSIDDSRTTACELWGIVDLEGRSLMKKVKLRKGSSSGHAFASGGESEDEDEDAEEDEDEEDEDDGSDSDDEGTGLKIPIEEKAFIVRNPFEDDEPDEKDEGYIEDHSATRDICHVYERTLLLLFHEKDEIEVLYYFRDGTNWTIPQLEASSKSPSDEERALAATTLAALKDFRFGDDHPIGSRIWSPRNFQDRQDYYEARDVLLKSAVKWKDVDLWTKVVAKCHGWRDPIEDEAIIEGFNTFQFQTIRSSLDVLVRSSKNPNKVIQALNRHAAQKTDTAVHQWISVCLAQQGSQSYAYGHVGGAKRKRM